jgi:hypothetical protein
VVLAAGQIFRVEASPGEGQVPTAYAMSVEP